MSMMIDGNIPVFAVPLTGQTITITMDGSAVSSSAIPTSGVYRVIANGDVRIAKDASAGAPAVVATDMAIRADQPEYFGLEEGSTVSAIGTNADIVTLTLMP